MELDLDGEDTLTVTVALDNDQDEIEVERDFFDSIDIPSSSHYQMNVDSSIRIDEIPEQIVRVLQLRLNPPEIGTMKNWQQIAMLLGMSLEEIAVLRTRPNPTHEMLNEFARASFNTLLNVISDAGRLDVLISLRPHVRGLTKEAVASRKKLNVAREPESHFMNSLVPAGPSIRAPRRTLPDRFILVTHHEPPKQSANTTSDNLTVDLSDVKEASPHKLFKFLWTNLKKWAEKAETDLFNINNCIDESNTQVSLNEHFSRAKQILLIASKSYYEEVCSSRSPIGFDRLGIKRQLHSLMDQEFVRNGMQNERFRVVLLSNLDRKYLPLGWASTTIVYTFPENHGELAKRLFED